VYKIDIQVYTGFSNAISGFEENSSLVVSPAKTAEQQQQYPFNGLFSRTTWVSLHQKA